MHGLFGPEEADAICSMPVCPRTQQDKLVWVGTKHGNYIVRSAYHMGKEEGVRDEGSCSKGHHIAVIWKGIWRINVPELLRLFYGKRVTIFCPRRSCYSKDTSRMTLYVLCAVWLHKLLPIYYGIARQQRMFGWSVTQGSTSARVMRWILFILWKNLWRD
jgi:hypothetical protein